MKKYNIPVLDKDQSLSISVDQNRIIHIMKEFNDYKHWFETTDNKTYYLFNKSVGYTGYSFNVITKELD